MKTITVSVTQEDIEEATALEFPGSTQCPIALALRRSFPGASVGRVDCGWKDGKTAISLPLPDEARKFVSDFDHGLTVKPSTFRLRVPA